MKGKRLLAAALCAVVTLSACGAPAGSAPASTQAASTPSVSSQMVGGEDVVTGGRDANGQKGVISTGRVEASEIGLQIMKAGGNAVDAAVAVGFALGVCEQQSSGIGGGGFMMVRFGETGETVFLDFRDQAGAAAAPGMWEVDENGKVKNDENKFGGKCIAVPGDVKGLLYALDHYGTMSREEVMKPAIEMAKNGFTVSDITSRDIKDAYGVLSRYPATAELYLNDGFPFEPGDTIKNPDLSATLELIAKEGEGAFYRGPIAEKIVAAVQEAGGYLTLEDFQNYEVAVREPVHGTYRGYDLYSSAPPSSGGSIIIEILNILENFDVGAMDPESAEYLHLLSEAMKLGFADRTKYMGDPAFVDVPVTGITSKAYAKELSETIDPEKAKTYEAGNPMPFESASTTHYSIMDDKGNMVAVTKTVDATFASGVVAKGTGILLNDTLFDFSTDPESPNAVAGGKKPLSSMSPTLILKDGKPFMSLGAPGTTRIITGVTQVITKVIDHGMGLQEAIDAVRMHDDFGTLILEDRVDASVKERLAAMGHTLNTGETWFTFPCVQAAMRLPDGSLVGAADPRRDGRALGY